MLDGLTGNIEISLYLTIIFIITICIFLYSKKR